MKRELEIGGVLCTNLMEVGKAMDAILEKGEMCEYYINNVTSRMGGRGTIWLGSLVADIAYHIKIEDTSLLGYIVNKIFYQNKPEKSQEFFDLIALRFHTAENYRGKYEPFILDKKI